MSLYLLCSLVFLISVTGSAIQASCGFGYGIFAMSVLPFLLPYQDALCASGMIAILAVARLAFRYREHILPKLLLVPVPMYFVTSLIGTHFLKSQADDVLRRALGCFLILLSVYLFFFSHKIKLKASPLSGAVAGGLGGLMGSLFGMGGPPVVIYMLSATGGTLAYIANVQAYFLLTNTYMTAVRVFNGMMNRHVALYVVCGVLGVLLGEKLGVALFRRLDDTALRRMVYSLMICMGILFLTKG